MARALHEQSSRRCKHFVAVNCGAVPENLIESELFGHEAGAFTGAKSRRIGKFEHANGGTLFLDEIESMPLQAQVHLLRVLQERAVEPIGANVLVPLDLRVVAASKVDLREAATRGEFREDLYYRLSVVNRYRRARTREDIPMLFHHFRWWPAPLRARGPRHPARATASADEPRMAGQRARAAQRRGAVCRAGRAVKTRIMVWNA